MKVLMLDVGGSNVKLMNAHDGEVRKVKSGSQFTPEDMVREVGEAVADWSFDCISMGYPGLLRDGRPSRDPLNLGPGWLDFEYEKAFGVPVRFMNDAAMQALGNYESGRLLFLGFGTSTGASLIADDALIGIEIGLLRFTRRAKFMHWLSKKGLRQLGRRRWLKAVGAAVATLQDVFSPDITVLGGGNAKLIEPMPDGCRRVENASAYRGAERLWEGADIVAMPRATTWELVRRPSEKLALVLVSAGDSSLAHREAN
ncbi:MAG: ROK family protein [Chthoniobacterales bacterium]